MNKHQRIDLPIYDDPITIEEFNGGLNSDPASSNLADNELMEGLNLSYVNKSLQRRLGASMFRNLEFAEEDPEQQRGIVQGQFTLTAAIGTYYIVVRDGMIYYSSLDHDEESTVLQHLTISITDDQFADAESIDPSNVLAGLTKYTEETLPNKFLNNEGYIYKKAAITDTDYLISSLDDSEESGLYIPDQNILMLQNYKKVGGAVSNNILYLATGTRYLRVYEVALNQLKAEIVPPKKIIAWEKLNIGENYLSPFPFRHVYSDHEDQDGIYNQYTADFNIFDIRLDLQSGTAVSATAILGLGVGRDENDYYFKWEVRDATGVWHTIYDYKETEHRASITYSLNLISPIDIGDTVRLKVTGTEDMVRRTDNVIPDPPGDGATQEEIDTYNATYGTWLADGSLNTAYWKPNDITRVLQIASAQVTLSSGLMAPEISEKFLEIHSCNKILSDGNKLILYGTPLNSANWYKTVIGKFNYISNQGQLNFQTNKNERIVKCIHLDGNIVVFANNPYMGGSIHAVTGNGDDYDDGQYYSPYKQKIVHDSISCDHPNSVQYVDNYIVFKNKNTFWQLQSRELNYERVQLISLNDNINHPNSETSMPEIPYSDTYEFDLYSFIDEETYTVVYPGYNLQYKMYYKLGTRNEHNSNKTSYPWLRDYSRFLNCQDVCKIANIPTYLSEGFKLMQFTNEECVDLTDPYYSRIRLKAFAMGRPGVLKYLNEIVVNYHRGETADFRMNMRAYNEAYYLIAGDKLSAFVDTQTNEVKYDNINNYYPEDTPDFDRPLMTLGKTEFGQGKMSKQFLYSRLYPIADKFPFVNVSVLIETDVKERFALNSLTFNFMSTDFPTQDLPTFYQQIFRKDYDGDIIVGENDAAAGSNYQIDYSATLSKTQEKLELAETKAKELEEKVDSYIEILTGPPNVGDMIFEED